jgi:hypothetical protein
VPGSCEHDHESSGSIKGEEFPGQLSDNLVLKKDVAQRGESELADIEYNLITQAPKDRSQNLKTF